MMYAADEDNDDAEEGGDPSSSPTTMGRSTRSLLPPSAHSLASLSLGCDCFSSYRCIYTDLPMVLFESKNGKNNDIIKL